jgi:hypothetical protein
MFLTMSAGKNLLPIPSFNEVLASMGIGEISELF